MNDQKRNPALKFLLLAAGLVTFIVGVSFASVFSFGFGSRYVTLALVLLAIGYCVYRCRKANCCS